MQMLISEPLGAIAQSGSAFEHARVSVTSVHQYVAAEAVPRQLALPSNLRVSAMYRPLVDSMLRSSQTFRRQCIRIAAEPMLTVRLAITQWFARSDVRATTVLRFTMYAMAKCINVWGAGWKTRP